MQTTIAHWNPSLGRWPESPSHRAAIVATAHLHDVPEMLWSVRTGDLIQPGDQVFLTVVDGGEVQGVVGRGHVCGSAVEAPSWSNPYDAMTYLPVVWTEMVDVADAMEWDFPTHRSGDVLESDRAAAIATAWAAWFPGTFLGVCPRCGSRRTVEFVYGMPFRVLPHQVAEGCIVVDDAPDRLCRECDHTWIGTPTASTTLYDGLDLQAALGVDEDGLADSVFSTFDDVDARLVEFEDEFVVEMNHQEVVLEYPFTLDEMRSYFAEREESIAFGD